MSEIIIQTIESLQPQTEAGALGMLSAQIQVVIAAVVGIAIIVWYYRKKSKKRMVQP